MKFYNCYLTKTTTDLVNKQRAVDCPVYVIELSPVQVAQFELVCLLTSPGIKTLRVPFIPVSCFHFHFYINGVGEVTYMFLTFLYRLILHPLYI